MFFKRAQSKTILGSVYERFVESAPVAVMARVTMERCLGPETIDRVFGETADRQYNKDLLFSTTFEILTETVCNVHSSVRAAHQAHHPEVGVSVNALYDKLKRTEPGIAAGLVRARELWMGDRNLCTLGWVGGVDERQAYFVMRQHANFPLEPLEEFRRVGRNDSGVVSEQKIKVVLLNGKVSIWRRIRVQLDKPTRDGEREILLVTNLKRGKAGARKVAQLYLGRWTIERVFQEIEATLNCEIDTLAYPKAALLGLSVGLVAHNILAVVKAAMRAAHGVQTVAETISGYYLSEELESAYLGLDIALPGETWEPFRQMSTKQLAQELTRIAGRMHLCRYEKHPRGPKKPQPPRKRIGGRGRGTHVSTARLLNPEAYVKK